MVCIVGHDDLDGIICHVLLEKKYPQSEHFYFSYLDLDGWPILLNKILDKERQKVYFVDLVMNDLFKGKEIEEQITNIFQKHELIWYDHHQWQPEDFGLSNGKIIIKPVPSAAEIVAKEEGLNDSFSQSLVNYASLSDAGSKDKIIVKLEDLIRSGYDKEKIILELTKENLTWSEDFEEARNDYLKRKEEALKEIKSGTYQKNFLAVALADKILFSKPAREYLSKKYPDQDLYLIMFKETKTVTLYSQKLNVGKMAKSFGGGGHSYSAGFQLNEIINERNYLFLLNKILYYVIRSFNTNKYALENPLFIFF